MTSDDKFGKANGENFEKNWYELANNLSPSQLSVELNITEQKKETVVSEGFRSFNLANLKTGIPSMITPYGIVVVVHEGEAKMEKTDSGAILSLKGYGPIAALTSKDSEDTSGLGNPDLSNHIKIEDIEVSSPPNEISESPPVTDVIPPAGSINTTPITTPDVDGPVTSDTSSNSSEVITENVSFPPVTGAEEDGSITTPGYSTPDTSPSSPEDEGSPTVILDPGTLSRGGCS